MAYQVLIPEDITDAGKQYLLNRGYEIKMGTGSSEEQICRDVADSFFILLALIVSNYYGFVPIWFTIIVILKLVDFILSSHIFSAGEKRHFVFDFLGRFTAVGFYLLPILVGIFPQTGIIKAAAFFLAITAVCSSTLRWFSFDRQTGQKSPNDIKDKNTDDTVAATVQSKHNTM